MTDRLIELLRLRGMGIIKSLKKKVAKKYDYEVGEHTYGAPQILFGDFGKLKIGKYCSIAKNVVIFLGGEHMTDWITTYPFITLKNLDVPVPKINTNVNIGNDVWIGYGVTILYGVTIGDGAILGARALITKDIPPYAIVGGVPAKIIRYRFETNDIKKLLDVQWWNLPDEEVDELIPLLLSNNVNELVIEVKKRKQFRIDLPN
jgi:acetyltransferase-like isoleucine patch superfamily enzyme